MDRFRNPFRPGAGTRPPALVGRDALIESFDVALRRTIDRRPGKSLMPIGLRGVGKTVLLIRFQELAAEQGVRVASIEAPEAGSLAHSLAVRLRVLLLELDRGPVSRAVGKALATLKSFTYNLPDGSSISLNLEPLVGAADSGLLSEDLGDLLVATGEAAAERGTGLVISVDEVQYLTETELSALITAIHRTVQRELPVMLVGAGLPQLPGLAGAAKSYAERLFDFPMIGSLTPADARDALLLPVRQEHVTFTEQALDWIVGETQGYPYFLQEWGLHAWNAAATSPIDSGDIETIAHEVRRQLDENFFMVRLDRLTPAERRYLSAMASLGPGPHRSGDVAQKLGVKVENVAPRRSALIRKGMIYSPAHGDTAFTVPLFDRFLRRRTDLGG